MCFLGHILPEMCRFIGIFSVMLSYFWCLTPLRNGHKFPYFEKKMILEIWIWQKKRRGIYWIFRWFTLFKSYFHDTLIIFSMISGHCQNFAENWTDLTYNLNQNWHLRNPWNPLFPTLSLAKCKCRHYESSWLNDTARAGAHCVVYSPTGCCVTWKRR